MKLTKSDWRLIAEALEMLQLDYEDGHPEDARIDKLLDHAEKLGFRDFSQRAYDVLRKVTDGD